MLTRRHVLRAGLVGGGYALLSSSYTLLGPGRGRRVYADDALPPSPPTTPFKDPLPIAAIAQPVARSLAEAQAMGFLPQRDPADCKNVDPRRTTAFHVGLHGPQPLPANTNFFLIPERQATHRFHMDLPQTSVWGYNGTVPGPTFIARSETPFLIRFVNELPENDPVGIGEPITAIHRHGGFQAPEDDGYPLDTFCGPSPGHPAESRDYYFPNIPYNNPFGFGNPEQNQESTMWYHDHAIDITGVNVYRGLAGFYLNFDELDSILGEDDPNAGALHLPGRMRGGVREFDIPIVIQDKQFDRDGRLVFDDFDHNGFLGDKFVVNGKIQPFLRVKRRKYRFRFLNGSNARFYELFLRNGQFFDIIGADDHLLPRTLRDRRSFRISPAERVEVVIDFSRSTTSEIILENRLEQTDGRKPGELRSSGTPILKFILEEAVSDPSRVPDQLRPVPIGPTQLLPHVTVKRTFEFDRVFWSIDSNNPVNACATQVRHPTSTYEFAHKEAIHTSLKASPITFRTRSTTKWAPRCSRTR